MEAAQQGLEGSIEGVPLIARAFRRLRPREGWLMLALAWAATITLPAAATGAGMVSGLDPTLWLVTLGLFAGWWLAHRSISGFLAAPCMLFAGLAADLIWGVHVLAIWPFLWQGGRWLIWLARWVQDRSLHAPPVTYFAEQGVALTGFGQRVAWWGEGLITGQGIADNLVLVGIAGLIAWCVAAWTGWWIARRGQPFVALVPTGVLLTLQVYFSGTGYWVVLAFLGLATLLLVLARLGWLMARWEAAGVDYSPEMRLEAIGTGIAIAGLALILAPTIPFLTSRDVSDAFWRIFRQPYQQMEEHLQGSFQGVQGARSLVPPSGVAEGGLPRAHLLGGRPELGREIALRARARGARPGEALYWRGQTFARYNGRGWDEDKQGVTGQELAAGESWGPAPPPGGRRSVLGSIEVVAASRAVLYGPGEPVSVDRPYEAIQRAPGELIALRGPRAPNRYTILGGVIDPDPNLLRAAGTDYPPEIAELYLQLPPDLPPDLKSYAYRVTAAATTPYDRALAIEAVLRQMPYSLDVPTPPQGRELVSWFLFDLGRGYCDYFATTMVVLARLSGVPARLAIGYAPGVYDERTGVYTMTELQAHSWPELYFPGYGWVPFEPTPAQSVPERVAVPGAVPPWLEGQPSLGLESDLSELRQIAVTESAVAARGLWARGVLGTLSLLAILWWFVVWSRLRSGPNEAGVGLLYARLARWGARLGRPLRPVDTPREYAHALGEIGRILAGRIRGDPARLVEAANTVQDEAARLAGVYELTLYGPEATWQSALSPENGQRWASLWSALRRLWLARLRI